MKTEKSNGDKREAINEPLKEADFKLEPGKNITSRDIAKLCGVSQTTVSYVMNNRQGVNISEKTRELVLATAKRFNYVPNSAARGMRMKSAYSIGVVVGRNVISLGFNHVLRGIKRVTDNAGYSITLIQDDTGSQVDSQGSSQNGRAEYTKYLSSGRIDGVIFCFCEIDQAMQKELDEKNVPYVIAGDNGVWNSELKPQDSMLYDAVGQVVQLCEEKKVQSVGFISIQYGEKPVTFKYDMLEKQFKSKLENIPLRWQIIMGRDREDSEILAELHEIIAKEEFDMVITPYQRLGMMVQAAIMKHNLKLPQNPKHICLDATHAMQMIYPSVTAVRMPLAEIGEESGKQILCKISGRREEPKQFTSKLLFGDSTL